MTSDMDDLRPQAPGKMPEYVLNAWHRRLAEVRDEKLTALIDDPDRDAWLDELSDSDIINGAAHVGVFASEQITNEDKEE